jgi:hydroxyethylthiazole kinase-like uncharacterized protein yjeF
MIPVLTPAEMAAVDRSAPEPVDVLVRRAAGALARAAESVLGGTYGRWVVVVAGPGNNGNDGRVAAQLLARRGVRCTVFDAAGAPPVLPPCDLVVDAAYGTGFRGEYRFPDPSGAPVLAVDVPSGISGLTGVAGGRPAHALTTVTFAALKPGLLLGEGPAHTGTVQVADIGLDVSGATVHLVEDADVLAWVPDRSASAHKWRHAVAVVAGSPGMTGAAVLSATAAFRAGAGYVRLTVPGAAGPTPGVPVEVVEHATPVDDHDAVRSDLSRFAALVVGPGLGRRDGTQALVRSLVARADLPLVLDGDGLRLLGDRPAETLAGRSAPTVLTPHDAEFEALAGAGPGDDRLAAARDLAARSGCTVLLKGPTTVVADPDGAALLVRVGDQRLATAGTGDVLSGTVAALLALGAPPLKAAAAGAHLHGTAAMLGPGRGLVASDVAALLPAAWEHLAGRGGADDDA